MTEKTDAELFIEQASYDSHSDSSGCSPKKNYKDCEGQHIKAEDREEKPTIFTQWSSYGTGFVAVGPTKPYLNPGVYELSYVNGGVVVFTPKNLVSDNLIRFEDSRMDSLLTEIEKFWTLDNEFKEGNEFSCGGFTHKRGYMVFGPPGSGKTSLIKFIIKDIVSRGGLVIMGSCNPRLIGEAVSILRLVEPTKKICVLFEDFDSLITDYREADYLSLLDGECSVDNCLFIGTTNYAHKLDARLYNRPGRFSDVIYIGMPNAATRRKYLEIKLNKHDDIEYIVENSEGFSLDHLKSLILGVYFEKKDLKTEIARLRKLFKPVKDNGNTNTMGL